jgi:hypothetical protein
MGTFPLFIASPLIPGDQLRVFVLRGQRPAMSRIGTAELWALISGGVFAILW